MKANLGFTTTAFYSDMPNPYFPFHSLGYQCNPFRAVTDAEWTALAVLPESIEAVKDAPYLQLLGDKGHGKTTALLALAAHLKSQGFRVAYEHLEVDQDHFTTPLAALDAFLLDEAQRLTPSERQRLLQANLARLIVAGHEDLTPLFSRFGLALVTVRLDTCSFTHIAAVVGRRLNFFALPVPPGAPACANISPQALAYLHTAFGADVRQIEIALYETFEVLKGREGVSEVTVEDIQYV